MSQAQQPRVLLILPVMRLLALLCAGFAHVHPTLHSHTYHSLTLLSCMLSNHGVAGGCKPNLAHFKTLFALLADNPHHVKQPAGFEQGVNGGGSPGENAAGGEDGGDDEDRQSWRSPDRPPRGGPNSPPSGMHMLVSSSCELSCYCFACLLTLSLSRVD